MVRKTMFAGSLFDVLRVGGLIGLFWGFWAIWAWQEYDLLSTGEFMLFAFVSVLPLIPAYAQLNRLEPLAFAPRRWELRVIVGLHGLWFTVVVAFIPYAVLILPPLLALIFGALRRHRRSDAPATISMTFEGVVSGTKYAALLLIPVVAVIWYAVFVALEARIATNAIVALVTVPASVVVFVMALFKLYRPEVVQGTFVTTTNAYYTPDPVAITPHVMEADRPAWVYGLDASEQFYKVMLSGQFFWVPANTIGPNFDHIGNGALLPTDIVN